MRKRHKLIRKRYRKNGLVVSYYYDRLYGRRWTISWWMRGGAR